MCCLFVLSQFTNPLSKFFQIGRAASPGGRRTQPSGTVRTWPSAVRTMLSDGPGENTLSLISFQLPCFISPPASTHVPYRKRPAPTSLCGPCPCWTHHELRGTYRRQPARCRASSRNRTAALFSRTTHLLSAESWDHRSTQTTNTRENVILGSKFCRDCGGVITTKYGKATCHNSPDQGKQKIEKKVCQILDPEERNSCEHCGYPDPGQVTCSNCGEFALLSG